MIIPFCSEDVVLPDGSTDVRCSFATFKKLIGKTLKHECVADTLQPFVDSLLYRAAQEAGTAGGKYGALLSFSSLMWTVFGVLMFTFLALVARHTIRRRMSSASAQKREYGTLPQMSLG